MLDRGLRVPKSSSCPNLCALDGTGHPPSSPRLSGAAKHRSQQELFSGSLQNSRSQQKPCHRAISGPLRAGFMDWPLAQAAVPDVIHEAADAERDLIQDAVWAKGLVPAGECFELYGWSDRQAPPLKDSTMHTMGPESDRDRDEKQRSLAACLASPFLFDNSNMGRDVRVAHEQATAEEQERVRARYTTEVGEEEKRLEREVTEREGDPLSEDVQQREGRLQGSYAGHQATQRSRRKRQLEEELLAAQYSSGGVPAAPALLSTDPITQKVLASVLGSLDDRSNRLELDRHELLRRSHDCLGLATMDAPSHDDPFTLAPPPGYRDRGHHDKEAFDEGDFVAAKATQSASLRTNTIPAMYGPPLSPINAHPQQTQPGRNLSNAVPFKRSAAKKTAGGRNAAKIKPHGPPENETPL